MAGFSLTTTPAEMLSFYAGINTEAGSPEVRAGFLGSHPCVNEDPLNPGRDDARDDGSRDG
jgi:hypothetical protein